MKALKLPSALPKIDIYDLFNSAVNTLFSFFNNRIGIININKKIEAAIIGMSKNRLFIKLFLLLLV